VWCGEPAVAARHFASLLALETGCWDVHEAMPAGVPDFVLLQTNGTPESFGAAHIVGAVHLHHRDVTAETLSRWPEDALFVVYCAGPHCNAADRAAARIAELGRHVKKMIGGRAGWLDEGFPLVGS
jgi:rhodanese-related sulfurtransferase